MSYSRTTGSSAILVLLFTILVAGCSSTTKEQSLSFKEQKRMQQELDEWRKLKPSLKRLVAVEGEIKDLVTVLASINEPVSGLQTADVANNVESSVIEKVTFEESSLVSESVNKKNQSEAIKTDSDSNTPIIAEANTSAGSNEGSVTRDDTHIEEKAVKSAFSLQLAAVTNPDKVQTTWEKLQNRYPDVLSDLDYHTEEVTVSNRLYYRVKAGDYSSYDEAKASCNKLAKAGASCIVNKG